MRCKFNQKYCQRNGLLSRCQDNNCDVMMKMTLDTIEGNVIHTPVNDLIPQ